MSNFSMSQRKIPLLIPELSFQSDFGPMNATSIGRDNNFVTFLDEQREFFKAILIIHKNGGSSDLVSYMAWIERKTRK